MKVRQYKDMSILIKLHQSLIKTCLTLVQGQSLTHVVFLRRISPVLKQGHSHCPLVPHGSMVESSVSEVVTRAHSHEVARNLWK